MISMPCICGSWMGTNKAADGKWLAGIGPESKGVVLLHLLWRSSRFSR